MSQPQQLSPSPGRPRALASLAQTIDVETPELVVFSYTIAGVGSRGLAAVIDSFICIATILAIMIGLAIATPRRTAGAAAGGTFDAWAAAIFVLAVFCVLWGYYVLFEGLADGQTPGKRLLRLRVVRDGGYSVTFGASAIRNLIRLIDIQPMPCYAVGIVSVMFSKSGKRLGDIVAGTIVVREALVRQVAPPAAPPAGEQESPRSLDTVLTEDEFTVLERFMERRSALDTERRAALATQIASRLTIPLRETDSSTAGTTDLARLVRLYESERSARARGAASRRDRGAARERNVLVATRSPRWNAFAATLADAQRRGLRALGENGVREFVSDYRDLASDLARLRTAAQGRETPELFYLSRLLAGAHNLLYRGRTISLADAVRLVALEAPREVRRSWRPVLLAAGLLFGPAIIAYSAVVRQPPIAATFIPPGMLDRAEEGVRRAREGTGYIPDPQIFRPTMASQIIANNVQVTFGVFALGITAGIGTLLLLVLNGVSFGGVMGLYQSKGIISLLLAFVAPHGVLELTAVCIAGGAGFLLGAALLIPGPRTRKRALVENGRRAIRLVAAATVLLLVAGSIEGFVSPIPSWPLRAKLAVSAATLVLLVLYLSSGRERKTRPGIEAQQTEEPSELLALE